MDSILELWELVRQELNDSLSEVIYKVWISDLELLNFDGTTVVLSTSEFKKRILEQKFMDALNAAFEKVFGFKVDVLIQSSDAISKEVPEERFENTFETFVVGSSNKFAYAAAQAVTAKPGGAYNPLFIYGRSGLGKTHLLRAICHGITKSDPSKNIIFTHGEEFTNELVHYIAKKNTIEFHDKYRSADVLLVDDVQFIAGRESTQEEFFHTFNALIQSGNQIVLSSDRPPKEILTLEERLRTRFEWGLIADIQPPDVETRMAIIKGKAQMLNYELPDDVIRFIAENIKNNIRQLEGAVKKMQAFTTIHGLPKSISTAKEAIKDIMNDIRPTPMTVEKIVSEVARTFGADPADIRSKKRDAQTSRLRQISMFIVSEVTALSTKAIGREFGGRDHSTVIYAVKEIKLELDRDPSLKATVSDIIKNIQEE